MMRYRECFCMIILILFCILLISLDSSARPAFDADRAFEYLEKQCEFGPRPPGSIAHKQTRDYLAVELRKYAKEVIVQRFIHPASDGKIELANIIAIFGSNADKKVLLAAHWDTRPFADHDSDENKRHLPILGANDGASGVAVLLELSRILHANPPDMQVIVVLFDGEDYGRTTDEMILGSRYFARNIDSRLIPDYGILIDMIGDKDLDIYIEYNSAIAVPDIVKKVWNLANKLGLREFHKEIGPKVIDDHIPLIEAGIKCINIIDFDYPYWHSTEDTPDKCSPESLRIIGTLLLELIYSQ